MKGKKEEYEGRWDGRAAEPEGLLAGRGCWAQHEPVQGALVGLFHVKVAEADGDHIPTVTLDVPAAVGAWGVVEGPGRAVDDATPFCVLLQFPTAGSCQERRLRSSGLT